MRSHDLAIARGMLLLVLVAVTALPVMAEEAAPPAGAEPAAPAVPGPPTGLVVEDVPNDTGHNLAIEWKAAPHDGATLQKYVVYRAESADGPWVIVARTDPGETAIENSTPMPLIDVAGKPVLVGEKAPGVVDAPENGVPYWFKVAAWDGTTLIEGAAVGPVETHANWFHTGRKVVLLGTVIFIALMVFMIYQARLGKDLYIRPIAGIQAVEEAIGRATEMGRPVLFVPGLSSIEDVATLAALNVLAKVAEKTAQYDTKLIVPNRDPIVFTVCQEIVREAHSTVGRPDTFDEKNIYFVSDRQFAYAAAVNGTMLREKPATNFFLGMFWAESLLLAETGNMTGAIQIAGTDAVTQLPFFIVACDYTLIGEELYAAGAYMGKDPKLVGSLKGQDSSKGVVIVCLLLGLLVAAVATVANKPEWLADFKNLFLVGT